MSSEVLQNDNSTDNIILEFGKFKGQRLEEVAKTADGYKYLKWVDSNKEIKLKHIMREQIKEFLKNALPPTTENSQDLATSSNLKIRRNGKILDPKQKELNEIERMKNLILSFGKYKTETLGKVIESEEGKKYLSWYIKQESANEKLKKIVLKLFKALDINI